MRPRLPDPNAFPETPSPPTTTCPQHPSAMVAGRGAKCELTSALNRLGRELAARELPAPPHTRTLRTAMSAAAFDMALSGRTADAGTAGGAAVRSGPRLPRKRPSIRRDCGAHPFPRQRRHARGRSSRRPRCQFADSRIWAKPIEGVGNGWPRRYRWSRSVSAPVTIAHERCADPVRSRPPVHNRPGGAASRFPGTLDRPGTVIRSRGRVLARW